MFPWLKLVTIHSGSCQNLEKTFHLAPSDPIGGKERNLNTCPGNSRPRFCHWSLCCLLCDTCELPLELRLTTWVEPWTKLSLNSTLASENSLILYMKDVLNRAKLVPFSFYRQKAWWRTKKVVFLRNRNVRKLDARYSGEIASKYFTSLGQCWAVRGGERSI